MEDMPVSQHPDIATQQPDTQTTTISHSTVVELLDAVTHKIQARAIPAFLKKRGQNKRVRWDCSVIFNEKHPKTPSTRTTSPPLPKGTLPKGLANSPSSQIPSASTVGPVSIANSSAKMNSPSVRPTQSAIPSGHSTFPGQDPCPWFSTEHRDQHVRAGISGRPPTHRTSTHRPSQAPAANSASKRKPGSATRRHMTREIEAMAITPPGFPQNNTQRPSTTATRIPPAVPDPPQPEMQGPPPTPRITRLPTPDLPDISRRKFCICNGAKCKTLVNHKGKPVHSKMNAQSKKPPWPSWKEHC